MRMSAWDKTYPPPCPHLYQPTAPSLQMSFMDDPFRWSAKCGVSVLDMLIFQGQVKEFIKMEKKTIYNYCTPRLQFIQIGS